MSTKPVIEFLSILDCYVFYIGLLLKMPVVLSPVFE
jgi:hypothetical protein